MQFLIADTFTASLARLTRDEQKAVKTAAFDFQLNPASSGMQFHKLEKSKDKNFWSVRVGSDIRLIVHKTQSSLLLCYVDHHDKAYAWAERRKLETHPKTGAAQLVEIRETVKEIAIPVFGLGTISSPPTQFVEERALFCDVSDDDLLICGVPTDWLDEVRRVTTEDKLLGLVEHLPAEASESLLELATGGMPSALIEMEEYKHRAVEARRVSYSSAQSDREDRTAWMQLDSIHAEYAARNVIDRTIPESTNPLSHPDAKRRFRVITSVEELERALEFPWDKWTVFLHPEQKKLVEREYSGPARVSGSAGTGKTIVALHRAVFLTHKYPDTRVLLATFSETLSNALHDRMRRLIGNEPRLAERLEVSSLTTLGIRLYTQQFGVPKLLAREQLAALISDILGSAPPTKFSVSFLADEWWQVVDAWQISTWEAYRDFRRLGRKTRLSEKVRQSIWSIFEQANKRVAAGDLVTNAAIFHRLAGKFDGSIRSPFEHIVVDESQDITAAQLQFLAALGSGKPEGLFFAGDLGQRIFQTPFSWKSVGVDIRGRSRTLTVNYRTSHQIRQHADHLLGPEVSDVDGLTEVRKGTISVFNGPTPEIESFSDHGAETSAVSTWIKTRITGGVAIHEVGVIVRSEAELPRAKAAVEAAGYPYCVLDDHMRIATGRICICTMHLAKGLEFRSVVVMACDDEIVPSQPRIEAVTDEADLEEVYATERHLLYVAVTRARDHLLVTSGGSPSEFLDDLRSC